MATGPPLATPRSEHNNNWFSARSGLSLPPELGSNNRRWITMPKEWTEEQIKRLVRLRELGASPARAALALKWNRAAVKAKARELGIPFPSWRAQRTEQRAKEAAARSKAGLPPKPIL